VANVGHGPRRVFELNQLNGAEDVGKDAEQEDGAGTIQEGDVVVERRTIGIESILTIRTGREIYLKIAQHVGENEADQDYA